MSRATRATSDSAKVYALELYSKDLEVHLNSSVFLSKMVTQKVLKPIDKERICKKKTLSEKHKILLVQIQAHPSKYKDFILLLKNQWNKGGQIAADIEAAKLKREDEIAAEELKVIVGQKLPQILKQKQIKPHKLKNLTVTVNKLNKLTDTLEKGQFKTADKKNEQESVMIPLEKGHRELENGQYDTADKDTEQECATALLQIKHEEIERLQTRIHQLEAEITNLKASKKTLNNSKRNNEKRYKNEIRNLKTWVKRLEDDIKSQEKGHACKSAVNDNQSNVENFRSSDLAATDTQGHGPTLSENTRKQDEEENHNQNNGTHSQSIVKEENVTSQKILTTKLTQYEMKQTEVLASDKTSNTQHTTELRCISRASTTLSEHTSESRSASAESKRSLSHTRSMVNTKDKNIVANRNKEVCVQNYHYENCTFIHNYGTDKTNSHGLDTEH